MIKVNRSKVIQVLQQAQFSNKGFEKQIIEDAMCGPGQIAIKYCIKNNLISIPDKYLENEIDTMVEKSLIIIEQWEQMKNLINNSQTGYDRVKVFLLKNNRIVIRG